SVSGDRPLFIPVLLGTPREGRMSEHVARFIFEETEARSGVDTELIDVRSIPLTTSDAGESIKDLRFSATIARADGLIIVTPEYNHSFPGILKHVLDTNLKEYIHKAVGICGVSAGIFGGARAIENLLPVLRELGLVTIFWDTNFPNVHKLFDSEGKLRDLEVYRRRFDQFIKELIWMAKTLRHGRESISLE